MNIVLAYRLLALSSLFLCVGCGAGQPALFPVSGKVLFEEKPAAGALVVFHSRGDSPKSAIKPMGKVDDKGDFTLTYDNQPGAPAGDYAVTIIWRPARKVPFEAEPADILEGRYADANTTKLTAKVESSPTVLQPFRVDE